MRFSHSIAILLLFVIFASAPLVEAEEGPGGDSPFKEKEMDIVSLTRENALLREKIKALECVPTLSREELVKRNAEQLRELAASVREQRRTMTDFEGFVKWMTANLSGYAKYVEAGSVAAGFAKILPIPYAGQASVLTKFVSQGVLSLNTASVAINRYLVTSQQFIARVEALDPTKSTNPAEISELARFADGELLRDMTDAQQKLTSTAEISTSALSFLESINSYLGSTDEYWNKTKSLLSRKEADKKEKSYL